MDKTSEQDKALRDAAQIPVREAGYRSVREFLNAMLKRVIANPKDKAIKKDAANIAHVKKMVSAWYQYADGLNFK